MVGALWPESRDSMLPRKAAVRGTVPPVPETDTGGLAEYAKAIEGILAKELGKSLPYLRYKGARARFPPLAGGRGARGHRPGGSDCLLKTQVRAKAQADAYALTPARCRKVKRTRQPPRGRSGEVKPR